MPWCEMCESLKQSLDQSFVDATSHLFSGHGFLFLPLLLGLLSSDTVFERVVQCAPEVCLSSLQDPSDDMKLKAF